MMHRLNTSARPKRVRRQRDTVAGPKGSTYTVYTQPSAPGEFLHKRTGAAQAGVTYGPTTPAAILAAGLKLRLGYTGHGKHGGIWELRPPGQRRLGLIDLAHELRGELAGIAAAGR